MGLSSTGFQNAVNIYPAPAIPGDFAGANIKANVVAGGQQFVASPAGVPVGTIGWANPTTGQISTYYQTGSLPCFIHRDNQGLITQFLGIATTLVQGNTEITGMDQGDFWGLFASGATVNQKVYANAQTGALTSNVTGNSVTGAITSLTTTAAAAGATSTMTVNTITGTPLAVGQVIVAVGLPVGTYISALGTGTGGTGTYILSNVDGLAIPVVTAIAGTYYGATETQFVVAQPVNAQSVFTATLAVPAAGTAFSTLTVSAFSSGQPITQGMVISSAGTTPVPASALIQVVSQVSGTVGGAGTYLVDGSSYVVTSGQTFNGSFGQLGKISSWTRST